MTQGNDLNRRTFLRNAGATAAAGMIAGTVTAQQAALPKGGAAEPIAHGSVFRALSDSEKVDRIASNSYPIRAIFRNPSLVDDATIQRMQAEYGVITMLDFPAFTKKTFPGVTRMDLWSSLFGDSTDKSQYEQMDVTWMDGSQRTVTEFDPASRSALRWLEQLARRQKAEGVQTHHISNNAPRDICELDDTKRRAGIAVAKKWLDAAAILGAKSMRVNSGGPRIAPSATADPSSYPKNPRIEQYLAKCIESFQEMAEYGGKVGVKVTLENHWGLTANPVHVRIIVEEVNSRWCEASPDFGNWENKYFLYHALADLAPYAHTTCHAKYWDRWENMDVQRNVRIMMNSGYEGVFALEYEDGPWNGIEGAKYLYNEVMAAL